MELITYWMYGVVAFGVLMAMRASPHEDARFLFRAVLVWPFSITVIVLVLLFDAIGWDMDAMRVEKMFGFRKPTNKEIRGFAVTVFFCEVQFWKKRKD